MPWFIKKNKDQFCVTKGTKDAPQGTVKCHPNRASALAHMRALYANTKGESMDEAAGVKKKGPYGKTRYADPGYQKDGKPRYPINSADHVRSAWSYINKPANAAKYTSKQVASIKARIRSAAKKFGVKIGSESAALDSAEALLRAWEYVQKVKHPLTDDELND